LGIGGGLWVIFFKKLMLKASVFVFFQFKVDKNADRYQKYYKREAAKRRVVIVECPYKREKSNNTRNKLVKNTL
jgi:hypothetical protein